MLPGQKNKRNVGLNLSDAEKKLLESFENLFESKPDFCGWNLQDKCGEAGVELLSQWGEKLEEHGTLDLQ